MADTLLDANQAAHQARAGGADHLDPDVLTQIRSHYLGALAKGRTDNQHHRHTLALQARRLIRRLTRYEDMTPAKLIPEQPQTSGSDVT
jgi:transposase